MPALGRIGLWAAATVVSTAGLLAAGGGMPAPPAPGGAPPEWNLILAAPAGPGLPLRILLLGLASASAWGTVVGLLALRRRHAVESRGWRIAVASFGVAGFLLGQSSGLWCMQRGAGEVLHELGTKAHALDLALAVHEGTVRQLLGCAAGAAGALGSWLLAYERRRAKGRFAPVTAEDPGVFAE